MNKNTLTLTLLLFSLFPVIGQNLNWKLTVPPRARSVHDVKIVDEGLVFVFGGSPANDSISFIARTEDAGVDWDVKKDKPGSPLLTNAHVIDRGTIMAVGEVGEVLRSVDSGLTYTKINLPSGVSKRKLKSIYFTTATHGFIVGGNPSNDAITTILESKDAGLTWSIIKDGLGPMLNDIHFLDEDNGICVGNSGLVMKTTDAGASWTKITITGNAGTRTFSSVYFAEGNNGFIVGGHPSNDSIQTVLRTKDSGSTWSMIRDNVNPMLQDINFLNENIGMAVGNNGYVMETKDGGDNWTSVNLPEVNDKWYFTSVDYFNDSNAVIGGYQGAVFIANAPLDDNTSIGASPVKNDFIIYPNPAKGEFEIVSGISQIFSIELLDWMGRVVPHKRIDNKIYLEAISNGLYHVLIRTKNGEVINQKLIIE